jgi:DNA-nicking Smr family endonuclease
LPPLTFSPATNSGAVPQQYARAERLGVDPVSVKLKLDLHDLYNRGDEIDRALRAVIDEAVRRKATLVEIIPGKGSGQLKKRVLRFLDQKEVKVLYDRVEKDSDNFGRVFVHFRWKKA